MIVSSLYLRSVYTIFFSNMEGPVELDADVDIKKNCQAQFLVS